MMMPGGGRRGAAVRRTPGSPVGRRGWLVGDGNMTDGKRSTHNILHLPIHTHMTDELEEGVVQ